LFFGCLQLLIASKGRERRSIYGEKRKATANALFDVKG
jgi:hypothetical protein